LIDKYTKQDCSSTPPDSFACIIKDIKNEIIDVSNSIRNTDYGILKENKNYIEKSINNFYTKITSKKNGYKDISLTIDLDHPAQKTISIPIKIEINELFKKIDENISEQEAIKNQFKEENTGKTKPPRRSARLRQKKGEERQKGGGRGKGGSSLSDLRNSGKFIKKSGRMRLKKKLNM